MSNKLLSQLQGNRFAIRQLGVCATGLLILESIAYKQPGGGLVRVGPSELGRRAGVRRQTAHQHLRKLEALGLVVKLGCAYMLNVKTILAMVADAVKARAAHLKRLFLKKKSQSVRHRLTHRNKNINPEPCDHGKAACNEWGVGETRSENLRALRELYENALRVRAAKKHNI